MKVLALFDDTGEVHAVFHPSDRPGTPVLQFVPAQGQRVETLEVPAELLSLKPEQILVAVYVDISSGKPVLVKRSWSQRLVASRDPGVYPLSLRWL
jgi:hypothetical protein